MQLNTDWYRSPSVGIAFAASVLLHGLVITLLPSLRIPEAKTPPPLVVELMPAPAPPPPIVQPQPPPPPPVKKPITPEKKVPPPPPPPVRELVLPKKPDVRPEPIPEPRVEPKPEPVPEPRVETPPPVAQPRVEPPPTPKAETPPPPAPRVETPTAPPPPTAIDSDMLKGYASLLSQAIAKKKTYPRIAQMRNWQGTAELKLEFGADGKLKNVAVTHGTGFSVLDEQAVKMVKDSQPLPQAPEGMRGRDFAVTVPVVFKLQD